MLGRFAISSETIRPGEGGTIPAAQYVRMSTEHQRYSTENQSDAILQYAGRYGFAIVQTYSDQAKSGLRIDGRDGLQQLLHDVESGAAGFKAILVYDVSRWGRFQDADESAYYEYICRRSGIAVHYCAEPFANDGSIASTIVKTVKRAMAGEYSRELSSKVFAGQARLIELGFKQGGFAGYGLRRRMIDQYGNRKAILAFGETKSLQSDRVVLEPGPAEEVANVRRMFAMFVHEGKRQSEIARILNQEQIKTDFGRRWTKKTVQQVLTNEKYIGNNVYNRRSGKLSKRRTMTPPEMWIRAAGVFPAIVDPELFAAARAVLARRSRRPTDEEMLAGLEELYRERGHLSSIIIDEAKHLPASLTYRTRFGGLARAYQLIGYGPYRATASVELNRTLRRVHAEVHGELLRNIERLGGTVAGEGKKDLMTINGEFTCALVIARCTSTPAGLMRWNLRLDRVPRPDITIAVRLAPGNREAMDYYLLPQIDMTAARLRLAERNGILLDAYRFDTLERFCRISARLRLRFLE